MDLLTRWNARQWHLPAAALAAAGTVLKIYQWYFSRPLWVDEEMALLNVRDRGISGLVGPLWLDQAAPLGWLTLQHLMLTAFGTTDRAIRAVPVLFGIATLWVAVWVAWRWMGPVAATAFLAMCAIGQWLTFYALEAKPYSADAFCGLLLPALAMWVMDTSNDRSVERRAAAWWVVAAATLWFSFGAMAAAPACALVLCSTASQRAGWRVAGRVAAPGIVWLASVGTHYWFSIRHARTDPFLLRYWAAAFPPEGGGPAGIGRWMLERAEAIASHPGGSQQWLLFWLVAAAGIGVLLSRRPASGMVALSVPVSAVLLGASRQLPFADRLALWTTPMLYFAIAGALGGAFERLQRLRPRRSAIALAAATALFVCAAVVVGDIVDWGRRTVIVRGSNHGLDDGRALRLLMGQREPGDVMLATQMTLPAVWWYGDVDIAEPNAGAGFSDGAPIFAIGHLPFGVEGCRRSTQLRSLSLALEGASRAAVYLGFASTVPSGFQRLVLDHLDRIGSRSFYNRVADEGIVAIYDLRRPPDMMNEASDGAAATPAGGLTGCVRVERAARW